MLVSSLFDYAVGRVMQVTERPARRRVLLGFTLLVNLGLLGFFKYFNFFAESLQALAGTFGWQLSPVTLRIILPVGISFYTFQTLSYTIDVYRRKLRATTSVIDYLAFVSFFPQLVAGPIERAENLLPQFAVPRQFSYEQACQGCRLILWGVFKKIALADRLALLVDPCYTHPQLQSGPELALATVCFAFQIYCDFSAYSDIAVGTASLFNIRLMRNFAYPYFSQNVAEFWRRWHISLSTWFRDYVYVPLGGGRTSPGRRALNVLVTFLSSGLWHGAAWRFVVWGGIHGGFVAGWQPPGSASGTGPAAARSDVPGGERMIPRLGTLLKMLLTFAIVCLTWVFFRAESLSDSLLILGKIASDAFSPAGYQAIAVMYDTDKAVRKSLVLLVALVLVEWLQRRHACPLELGRWPTPLRWATYTVLIWATLDLVPPSAGQEFIYFDF